MRTKQFLAAKAAPFPGVAALVEECETLRRQVQLLQEKVDSMQKRSNDQQLQLDNLLGIIEQISRARGNETGQTEKQAHIKYPPSPLMKIKTGKANQL